MKEFFSKKTTKRFLIPAFLFLLGLLPSILGFRLDRSESFSVLSYDQPPTAFHSLKTAEILAGEKLTGEFKAIDNNLGIIAIRFKTFARINDDLLIFRLKEKIAQDWYYENQFNLGSRYTNAISIKNLKRLPIRPPEKNKSTVKTIEKKLRSSSPPETHSNLLLEEIDNLILWVYECSFINDHFEF